MDIVKVTKQDGLIIINPDAEAVSYREGSVNRFSQMVDIWVDQGGEIEEINKTLDDLKKDAIGKVEQFASSSRAKIAGNADQYKLAGWAAKAEAARRVLAGVATTGEIAAIQLESDKRGEGESVTSLAQKIVDKADRLQQANGVIEGMESAAIAAIESKQKESEFDELMGTLLVNAESELQALLSQ